MRRMRLWIAALVLLGAIASVLLLPRGDAARVAALECHTLLRRELAGYGPTLRIGDAVLDGPAVEFESPHKAKLFLYGVRFAAANPPTDDPAIHDLARRSLIRGLRELADERGVELAVNGEAMPTAAGQQRGANFMVMADGSTFALVYTHPDGTEMHVEREDFTPASRASIVPPLLAIVLAILWRRPLAALFAGICCASWLLLSHAGAGWLSALFKVPWHVASELLWPQVADPTNLQIVGFTLAMIAMIGVMSRSGGMQGIADAIAARARGPRSAQTATWLVGVLVFFDDYASCILTGSTMRRVTDAYRVSREKLAYLVDSTAAPIASIAVFSSWIAFQVSTYAPQLPGAHMSVASGFAVFVETLPYRFYCVFTVLLAGLIALSGRDFGPMLKAERRARTTGQLLRPGARLLVSNDLARMQPEGDVVPRAHRAIVPVLVFVLITLLEIVRVGFAKLTALDATRELATTLSSASGWTELLAQGDSVRAMWIGSLAGLLCAVAFAFTAGLRGAILNAAWGSLVATFAGIAILYCAWMIAAASKELGTATYLTEMLGDKLAPQLLPTLLFLIACGVSFSTGTSWGTMGMLLPLVVGLAFTMGERTELGGHLLVVISIAAVLDGAIFGDHCSPLASTSILSSISCLSDLIDHVRTQLPYGLAALALTVICGLFPATFLGWSPWLSLGVGAAALLMLMLVFGRRVEPARALEPLPPLPQR